MMFKYIIKALVTRNSKKIKSVTYIVPEITTLKQTPQLYDIIMGNYKNFL